MATWSGGGPAFDLRLPRGAPNRSRSPLNTQQPHLFQLCLECCAPSLSLRSPPPHSVVKKTFFFLLLRTSVYPSLSPTGLLEI